MGPISKKISVVVLGVFIAGGLTPVLGQDLLLGAQPAITVEPWYEEGEMDINILPFVYLPNTGMLAEMRFISLVNYHFGDDGGVKDVGLEIAKPWYYKETAWYGAPVALVGVDLLEDRFKTTLTSEFGYSFETEDAWRFNLGFQLGATFFGANDAEAAVWRDHIGVKFYFGKWF